MKYLIFILIIRENSKFFKQGNFYFFHLWLNFLEWNWKVLRTKSSLDQIYFVMKPEFCVKKGSYYFLFQSWFFLWFKSDVMITSSLFQLNFFIFIKFSACESRTKLLESQGIYKMQKIRWKATHLYLINYFE